ncbi:hypothetical protein [Hyunsoonleella flava]|uniref:hypothetical protein n=1 Tax=Hyunsoonleella flava TaxID=2527939 RepID=UPI0013EEEEDA|nr:hypothetical protein [Hyunsoonleella flava]
MILVLFYSCKNDRNLDGNYSICNYGEYAEVYFKGDFMRVASESEWVKLSEWKQVKINNDTLYFESFGEWRDNWKAEIKYIGKNKIELYNLATDISVSLEPINVDLNFENSKEFWKGFKTRKNLKGCK